MFGIIFLNEAMGLNSNVKFQLVCPVGPHVCCYVWAIHVWSMAIHPLIVLLLQDGYLSESLRKWSDSEKKHKEHEKYQWIIHWIPPKTHQSLVSNFGISKKNITLWLWLT